MGGIGLWRFFPNFLMWQMSSAVPSGFAAVTVDDRTEIDAVPTQLKGDLHALGTRL